MRASSSAFARKAMRDSRIPVERLLMSVSDAEYAELFRQYGMVLNCLNRIIDATHRGFGEAQFTQDRVLRMMANAVPLELRCVFINLP